MELNLFSSILSGSMKPTNQSNQDLKFFSNYLSRDLISPDDIDNYHSVLKTIYKGNHEIFDKEELDLYLNQPEGSVKYSISKPLVELDYPDSTNPKERFYFAIIKNECTRIFNKILQALLKDINESDRRFIINYYINSIKELMRLIGNNRPFWNDIDMTSLAIYSFLELTLIRLLLEIELSFNSYLVSIPSDSYVIFDELLKSELPANSEFYKINPELKQVSALVIQSALKIPSKDISKVDALSFGFNGDLEVLRSVIISLERQIDFIKESTTLEDLIEVFTSKNLTADSPRIYLGCETQIFRYIIDQIKPLFKNLKLTAIDKSGLFYSLQNPEKPITRDNLSSSIPKTDVKGKATIDSILRQLK
jgi:hypothetical protein